MASTTPIRIVITGDAEDAKRALHDLDSSLGTAEGRLHSFGSSLTSFGKISALVSLGTDALALAANLAPALGILAALPAVAATAAAAIGTLFVGLHGLSDAFKTSASAGGGAAVNTTAYQRAIESAARGVTQAERDLSDAQQKSREAQDALNQARIQAAADLAAYVDKLADANLNEESASIALQEAQQNLQQVQQGNAATALQLEQAQLQVAQSQQNLESAQQSGTATALQLQQAQLAVAQAQENLQRLQAQGTPTALDLEKANYDVADAAQRYKEAQEAATQTQSDANDAAAKGVDGSDAVIKAQQDLDLANRNVADSQEKILLAQQQLADAQANLANATDKASGAVNKQAEAMAALSPNARAFVQTILAMKEQWTALHTAVQDALFANLASDVSILANVSFPTLRTGMTSVATGFNEIAASAMNAMSTPMFQGALASIFQADREMLDQWAPAVGALTTGFANLAQVALPFLERFNTWLTTGATHLGVFLSSAEGAERMRQVLEKATGVLQTLWAITKDVVTIFANLFKAADSMNMLGVLQQITGELAKWSGSAKGQQTLKTLFEALGQIAPSLASNLPTILTALSGVASAFQSLPGPVRTIAADFFAWSIVLGPIIEGIAGIVGFIAGLGATAAIVIGVVGVVIALGAAAIYAYNHFQTFHNVVDAAVSYLTGTVFPALGAAADWIVQQFQHLYDFWLSIWPQVSQIVGAAVTVITEIIRVFAAIVGGVWDAFGSSIMATVSFVFNTIWNIIQTVVAVIANVIKFWLDVITGNWSGAWNALWSIVTAILGGIGTFVSQELNWIVSVVTGMGGSIGRAASGMWDGIKEAFRAAVNWMIQKWNDFHLTIGGTILGQNLSFTLDTPNIPYLASGGMFSGFAVVGEKGPELVYSPNRLGVMSNSDSRSFLSSGSSDSHTEINFHPGSIQSNANPFDIANEIAWQQKTQRRAS